MGIIPVADQYGVNCLTCFPSGKTPEFLKVFVAGVMPGDLYQPWMGPAPNGYHDMQQLPGAPCSWAGPPLPLPQANYKAAPDTSGILVYSKLGFVGFLTIDMPVCQRIFANGIVNPAGQHFYGGDAFVTTPAEMKAMIESVTPMIDPDPRMECFPMANKQIVIRYAGKHDATNISIKLDVS